MNEIMKWLAAFFFVGILFVPGILSSILVPRGKFVAGDLILANLSMEPFKIIFTGDIVEFTDGNLSITFGEGLLNGCILNFGIVDEMIFNIGNDSFRFVKEVEEPILQEFIIPENNLTCVFWECEKLCQEKYGRKSCMSAHYLEFDFNNDSVIDSVEKAYEDALWEAISKFTHECFMDYYDFHPSCMLIC